MLSRKPATALEVGSLVQLVEDPTRTGRIRWMGTPPETKAFMAGVELVSLATLKISVCESFYVKDHPMEGCGDGELRGERYFHCRAGTAHFCSMSSLRHSSTAPHITVPVAEKHTLEAVPPYISELETPVQSITD